MKDKILIWLDVDLEHFGLAHSFQKKFDSDLYAIIDINNKGRSFFENQKFVDFSKTWFFRNCLNIKNTIPDLDYLKKFEKKYSISLWQIAYSDRYFFKYNPYHHFKSEEILNILEQECKFFEKVLDEIKPDYLFVKVTDYTQNYLLHQICKGKKIKILTYGRTRLGFRSIISEDADFIDDIAMQSVSISKNKTFDVLLDYINNYSNQQILFRKKNRNSLLKRISSGMKFLSIADDKYRNFYPNIGRTRYKVLKNELLFLFNRYKRANFQEKISIKELSNKPYAYFPMHLEPERMLSIAAPYFTNQLEVITQIAKSLPVDYTLYVKDHPGMKDSGWRSIDFYQNLIKLPNVKLLHPYLSESKIIPNSSLVISIAGTGSMQAAFYQKPSIVFADTIFSDLLPSVHRLKSLEELPQAIRESLNKKVDLSDLNNFVKVIEKNSFEFDYFSLYGKINEVFYKDGFLKDIEIPMKLMSNFLDNHNDFFEKLAEEHMKKILSFKNSN